MSQWYPRPKSEMSEEERVQWRLDTKTDKSGGPEACWPWFGAITGNGYPHISGVTLYGETKKYPGGHRTSWALKNGRWPVGREVVMHSCDNSACVNPKHLSVGTQRENISTRGRSGRWFGCGVGKLTDEQVRWVRENGLSQTETAKALEISQPAVSQIRQRKSYRHVA